LELSVKSAGFLFELCAVSMTSIILNILKRRSINGTLPRKIRHLCYDGKHAEILDHYFSVVPFRLLG
jgi:hypothetical protein